MHNSEFDASMAITPLHRVAELVQIYFFVLCILLISCLIWLMSQHMLGFYITVLIRGFIPIYVFLSSSEVFIFCPHLRPPSQHSLGCSLVCLANQGGIRANCRDINSLYICKCSSLTFTIVFYFSFTTVFSL